MAEFIDYRDEYNLDTLDREDLRDDPMQQFKHWFNQAKEAECDYPEGFTLATSDVNGEISARIVLMKLIEDDGFVFFTNYDSHKAQNMADNAHVSASFFWGKIERQARFMGTIEKVPREVSEAYFATRPRGSQLSAWVSKQSTPAKNREEMEAFVKEKEAEFEGKEIPAPPFWGGYKITIKSVEFWQGRPSRLHDRFLYEKQDEEWIINRLWP